MQRGGDKKWEKGKKTQKLRGGIKGIKGKAKKGVKRDQNEVN